MTDQIICHCASKNCANCPMKKTGTSGIVTKWDSSRKHKIETDENAKEILASPIQH